MLMSRVRSPLSARLQDILAVMSIEQRDDFDIMALVLTTIFIGSTIGALAASAVILVSQVAVDRVQALHEKRAAQARRLRHKSDGTEVVPPALAEGRFHVFLSHTWAQGEEQMRTVKLRLLEMMPDLRVFLDKDGPDRDGPNRGHTKSTYCILHATSYMLRPTCGECDE